MNRTIHHLDPWATISLMALALLGAGRALTAGVTLSGGEPDANCSDLRLWLRADAGIRDAGGRSPADPEFSGSAATWSDQSGRHFDLAAPPEQAPSYVARQPGAGNRPTVAFGSGRMLVRPNDTLHDHVNSTTLLVMQIQRSAQQESIVYCAGDPGGRRDSLSFQPPTEGDSARGYVRWWTATQNGTINLDSPLQMVADGRFAIVVLQSAGEATSVSVQDGLGDALGADREPIPSGHSAVSNQCGHGYCLGGPKPDQALIGYDGQVAEVLVYNRALSSAERRTLVGYLRRKYELDVLDALYPAATMLLQAEDFDGAWPVNFRWDQIATATCLGQRHVTSKSDQIDDGIKRSVFIPQAGSYSVWVRAYCGGKESGLQTSVGGKPLAVTHAQGPNAMSWQFAGKVDLQPGETEIAVRGAGPGRKECDAVFISPSVTTQAGIDGLCALARRLRQATNLGPLAAVFDDGRRIEGNLVSGWRGNGVSIARDGPGRPGLRCLSLDGSAADSPSQSDAVLEFHNGDRIRGTICGYAAAFTQSGPMPAPRCWCSRLKTSARPRRNRSPWRSIGCGGSRWTRPGRPATARRGRSFAATAA